MQFLDFLVTLLPTLFWGSVVLINVFVGGGPYNQIRGTTLGALIVGLGLLITGFAKFNNPTVIIVGLISGALWAFGQANQLKSISLIGVSNTTPVPTGVQLVSTTLPSVTSLGEWLSTTQIIFGLIAMILLVTGVAPTSLKAKNERQSDNPELEKAMGILIVSTVGYVDFVVLGDISGVGETDVLFFQSVGMAIGGFILFMNHKTPLKSTALNLLPGAIWGVGNLSMFYSQPKAGVATSFSLSQLFVIVSTLGGIFISGERKGRRRMTGTWAGIVIIVIAAIILGNLKQRIKYSCNVKM